MRSILESVRHTEKQTLKPRFIRSFIHSFTPFIHSHTLIQWLVVEKGSLEEANLVL